MHAFVLWLSDEGQSSRFQQNGCLLQPVSQSGENSECVVSRYDEALENGVLNRVVCYGGARWLLFWRRANHRHGVRIL